jgi:hypothetical protein
MRKRGEGSIVGGLGGEISGGHEQHKRALDAQKTPGAFLIAGRRPGKEILISMRKSVGTTYCLPSVKLTPAE